MTVKFPTGVTPAQRAAQAHVQIHSILEGWKMEIPFGLCGLLSACLPAESSQELLSPTPHPADPEKASFQCAIAVWTRASNNTSLALV